MVTGPAPTSVPAIVVAFVAVIFVLAVGPVVVVAAVVAVVIVVVVVTVAVAIAVAGLLFVDFVADQAAADGANRATDERAFGGAVVRIVPDDGADARAARAADKRAGAGVARATADAAEAKRGYNEPPGSLPN